MKNKGIKRIGIILVFLIALGSSIKVEKLDEVRARTDEGKFDAVTFAEDFWNKDLIPNLNSAIEVNKLIGLLETNPKEAFENYSKALGIGNIRFFMIRGEGEIRKVGNDDLTVLIKTDSTNHVLQIETEYIFGNAVRDASGRVDLQNFEQTSDFNNVSAEINLLIRQKVLPIIDKNAQVGKRISFVGAIELNRELNEFKNLEVIPVKVEFFTDQKD